MTAELSAHDLARLRLAAYTARLPLDDVRRDQLLDTTFDTLPEESGYARLHRQLVGADSPRGLPDSLCSVAARLALKHPDAPLQNDRHGRPRLLTTPPLTRSRMKPQPLDRSPLRRLGRWLKARLMGRRHVMAPRTGNAQHATQRYPWQRQALLRRLVLLALILGQTVLATGFMTAVLPYHGTHWLELLLLAVYAILFAWVSAGFWTAVSGFLVLITGWDRHAISRSWLKPLNPEARSAILMPICNEDVARVFAGLRATYTSLARTGPLTSFDFFVLSDSSNPDIRVAEIEAWLKLCEDVKGFGRIFYRRRQLRIKRKSGNIADWCRRWGSAYRYMIILDADSVMSGGCLVKLAQLMEANPNAGIIQTAPQAAGRETLYARIQQFANRVYGPLFTAGLHYWQLGESHYWGHNAIIRLEPFMKHCVLAPLPGRGSLAGEILSHDFVEAALMRRAGYGVWIAHDLDGSFEETPPNLLDEVKRDRRWCHGNLMNARLMFARGMHPVHRWVFLTGALAYLSAPLWLGFLALSTWLLLAHANVEPQYFSVPHQLFPHWPSWRPEHAWALFAAIAAVLFVPKIMAALLAAVRGASSHGGILRLTFSVFVEMLMSALLAPIRMLFHTQFVFAALLGWSIQWKSPSRADKSTSITQALRRHGLQTAIGLAWVGVVAWKAPDVLPWIAPVAAGLLFAIPISVLTSYSALGLLARRAKLFMTPDETRPPREVVATAQYAHSARALPRFADAVIDPDVHAAVRAAAHRSRSALAAAYRAQRVERAVHEGPDALSSTERVALLHDGAALDELQRAAKIAPVHPSWYASSTSARRATIKVFGRPHEASKTVATLVRAR